MLETIRYRVGQFFQALTARMPEEMVERATRTLPPRARDLFRRQTAQDQRHALAVYHALRQAGHAHPHLLAAALLHDVGKAAARLPAWQRAIIVLLNRFAPRLLARLGRGELRGAALNQPNGWRRPFIVHIHHPEIGARWAEEADCSPLTVALIRRHQDKPAPALSCAQDETGEENRLLAALQAADDTN
jgi:hypothetical protein